MNELKQFIQFKLGSDDYAVEMGLVREIIKPVKVKPLLGAPEFIQGIAKVRDGVVTIVDIRKKYALTPFDEGEPRIIIFDSDKDTEQIGLWVDDVVEILESNSIEQVPHIIFQGTIQEIIKTDEAIIPVLDINKLFSNDVLTWLGSNDNEITNEKD
ncbi:chemotaxis signal transduction protein [Desulfosporosinus acidiphilus SJ4]|uniref:Chemotaxis signal transduction protein n=1 Tax=Desulfosporosinus acidiphilus (strain DSM 22704 / JCM 16185 / SJ4) TaxID=646529 RepID=I4D9L5_DESAJ|nr:chemotaxis protein CheW [Desulfosporosinus acidiphilus]AFM42489.1 chemotaxis signal transduction protein [Desulfosporosinus acidiphilus SJ4]